MIRKLLITLILLLFCAAPHCLAGIKGSSAWGIKLTTPQLLAASYTMYPYHLWLVQLEPGIGGGKLNVGLGGNWQYTVGAALKVSLLQTWLYPIGGLEVNQTYIGGEGELMWKGVNVSFGIYSHIAGDNSERDTIVSAGLGIGF